MTPLVNFILAPPRVLCENGTFCSKSCTPSSGGNGGASLAWPGCTRDVILVDRESGPPSNSRLSVSWQFAKAGLWVHCCARSGRTKTRCRSAKTRQAVPQGDGFHVQTLSVQFKKKRNQGAFEHTSQVSDTLSRLDHEQQCELLYIDESGFSTLNKTR